MALRQYGVKHCASLALVCLLGKVQIPSNSQESCEIFNNYPTLLIFFSHLPGYDCLVTQEPCLDGHPELLPRSNLAYLGGRAITQPKVLLQVGWPNLTRAKMAARDSSL